MHFSHPSVLQTASVFQQMLISLFLKWGASRYRSRRGWSRRTLGNHHRFLVSSRWIKMPEITCIRNSNVQHELLSSASMIDSGRALPSESRVPEFLLESVGVWWMATGRHCCVERFVLLLAQMEDLDIQGVAKSRAFLKHHSWSFA